MNRKVKPIGFLKVKIIEDGKPIFKENGSKKKIKNKLIEWFELK